MKVTTLGIDLAKSVFPASWGGRTRSSDAAQAVATQTGAAVLDQAVPVPGRNGSMRREPLLGARDCQARPSGAAHESTLGAPYVKSSKNDRNDAEAICEAVSRTSMRFVPIKSAAQQDLQSLHRVRSQLIRSRTALANEIRGLLGEYGIATAKELAVLRRALPLILEDQDNGLSGVFRETLVEMVERLNSLMNASSATSSG